MRNAVRRIFEFSIIDKGIVVSAIECRTVSQKEISNLYWNEFFLSTDIVKNIRFRPVDRNRKPIEEKTL
jgi:hypothetical protein